MITELSAAEALELDIEVVRRILVTGTTREVIAAAGALLAALIASRATPVRPGEGGA